VRPAADVTSATQPTLFEIQPIYEEMSLDERWWFFSASNTSVTRDIGERALRMADDGYRRVSVKLLFELVRGEAQRVEGSKFHLDNSPTAPCARWLIRRHPHLADLIEVRPSKADKENK
jgi:hypothetical protein